MKSYYIIGVALLALFTSHEKAAAQNREQWEFEKDIPVYVDSIQRHLSYPLAYRNYPDKANWHQVARQKIFELMGPRPPKSSSWQVKVLAEEQRKGYKAQKIEIALSAWYKVRALLLLPDTPGRKPAVNLLHDHGAHLFIGKEKMIRPVGEDSIVNNDAQKWVDQLYEGQFLGDYLAQHGYVVISADAPMWGERGRKEGVDRAKYDRIAGNMMMLGRNLCAQMHYDDLALNDFLCQLPEVDSTRLGCAGCSMGGYRAWMLSALDPRVKASCVVCWMTTTRTQLSLSNKRAENGGFANCIPLLRNYLDYPDIASLTAPRALMVIAGSHDKLFSVEGDNEAFRILQDVWNDMGATRRLQTEIFDQPHECNLKDQEAILHFLDEHLK